MSSTLRFALLWLLSTTAVLACPVCGGGDAPNQQAFVDTMVFMSLLPLAMLGGVSAVFLYRARQLAQKEQPTN